jgi:membrane protein
MTRESKLGDDPHGRLAGSPGELPGAAWRDIGLRVWKGFSDDRLLLVGAGAAFYILLALVPALASFVAIYGLLFDRASVVEQVSALSSMLAPEVRTILVDQLQRLTSEPAGSLGAAFAVSLAVSLWSASAGTKAVMDGLNIVYAEDEKRGFLRYNATALAMTLAGLVGAILTLGVTLLLPVVLAYVWPDSGGLVQLASYAVLLALVWLALIALYRWGPSRVAADWRWLAPGTLLAVVMLVVFSVLFSWFARTFATYSGYGSLGAIIAFMTWVWLCMVIVLLGAEVNAEMEHQTGRDSTVGPGKPRGARGAAMADSIGAPAGSEAIDSPGGGLRSTRDAHRPDGFRPTAQ